MELKKIGWEVVDWTDVAKNKKGKWPEPVNMVTNCEQGDQL